MSQEENTKLKIYNITAIRHIGNVYLIFMHKENWKVCRFFVVTGGSPALLGMSETQGVLTTND